MLQCLHLLNGPLQKIPILGEAGSQLVFLPVVSLSQPFGQANHFLLKPIDEKTILRFQREQTNEKTL